MRPIGNTLTIVSAVLTLTTTAFGQLGQMAGFAELMRPEYQSRDLTIMDECLGLDRPQRNIVKMLHEDYLASFEAGVEAMRQQLRDLRGELSPDDPVRSLQVVFAPFETWAKARRELGETLIADVELVLNDRQRTKVPAFRRRLFREKSMPQGVLSGESVDLLLIARQVGLHEATRRQVQPVLDEYELALDAALRDRQAVLATGQTTVIRALQRRDAAAQLELIDAQLDARIEVRDVNDRFLAIVAEQLPADAAERFRRLALERGYPQAYRTTPAERMFGKALELPDLTGQIRQGIIDLQRLYLEELDLWRDAMTELLREFEPRKTRNRVERMSARMTGGVAERIADPTLASRQERKRLDGQYVQLLEGLLTETQRAALDG